MAKETTVRKLKKNAELIAYEKGRAVGQAQGLEEACRLREEKAELAAALKTLLTHYACPAGCKPTNTTCGWNNARAVLKKHKALEASS
ncbi:MAG: hypothetical protein EHM36_00120 [Deltaproteobacteria bacterium]|nr:MAG: hypothetical protein EHM36_00120 [Deltaproteobacteria bacterium]